MVWHSFLAEFRKGVGKIFYSEDAGDLLDEVGVLGLDQLLEDGIGEGGADGAGADVEVDGGAVVAGGLHGALEADQAVDGGCRVLEGGRAGGVVDPAVHLAEGLQRAQRGGGNGGEGDQLEHGVAGSGVRSLCCGVRFFSGRN